MSGEAGHYEVTLHRRRGWDQPLRRTFPFGQWAEIGYWLDEVGAGEGDSLAVSFHPLEQPVGLLVDLGRIEAAVYDPRERDELLHGLGDFDGGEAA